MVPVGEEPSNTQNPTSEAVASRADKSSVLPVATTTGTDSSLTGVPELTEDPRAVAPLISDSAMMTGTETVFTEFTDAVEVLPVLIQEEPVSASERLDTAVITGAVTVF